MAVKRNKNTPMGLRAWWDHVGTENVHLVIEHLGSSLAYFRKLRYRSDRRPSYDFARRIIAAASTITPGFVPDLALLMEPPTRCPTAYQGGKPIPPSAAFQRSQKRVTAE